MDKQQEIDSLFRQYIEICNQAMQQNKDAFPYKYIWEAVENVKQGQPIDLDVYDDEPQHYRVKIENTNLELLDYDEAVEPCSGKMKMSYLREVVEHPEEYINQPARLDWAWLKNTD